MFKLYEVGGTVRDELMGLQSKDIDFVVVPSQELLDQQLSIDEIFQSLTNFLEEEDFLIFLSTPSCFTIRAKFPPLYKNNSKYSGVADFVLARKEVGYVPGTREPIVVPGTLFDDLVRRDFTVNAIAKDPETNELIDPFDGVGDLKKKVLKTPIKTQSKSGDIINSSPITFEDDPLRLLRAIRFSITKDFEITNSIKGILHIFDYENKMGVVSEERIREELFKCFKANTLKTLEYLEVFSELKKYIFTRTNLWLKPTNEQK